MLISTKGRYGLKAMYMVATGSDGGPVSIRSIAEAEGISEQYLEQLMKLIRTAGLIQSFRGAGGGYRLTRSAADISVGDILRSLEGDLAPTECVAHGGCGKECNCSTKTVWNKLYKSINDVIDGYSLQDMIDDNEQGE